MSTEQKSEGFNAQDFERYHSGKMTPQEMHAIEKAALDDPFLNDALEGYKFSHSPVADVQSLSERIYQRKENKKKVFYLQPLLKIAAVFLLIGGLYWLVFKEDNDVLDKKVVLAENDPVQIESSTGNDSTLLVLSNGSISTRPQATEKKPATISADSKIVSSQYVMTDLTSDTVRSDNLTFMRTESETKFEQSTASATSVENGLVSQNKDLAKEETADANVAMSKKEVGYDKQPSAARSRIQIIPHFSSSNVSPLIGWTGFNEGVKKLIENRDHKSIVNDQFDISFTIDPNGFPANVLLSSGICMLCKTEVSKLIQDYQWKLLSGDRAVISVTYK